MEYIVKTGPADTLEALGELLRRLAGTESDLMTCGEILRREGELKGRREGELRGRLETIEGFLQAGIKWPVIQSATGIDEPTYRSLKRDAANGTEQTGPRLTLPPSGRLTVSAARASSKAPLTRRRRKGAGRWHHPAPAPSTSGS